MLLVLRQPTNGRDADVIPMPNVLSCPGCRGQFQVDSNFPGGVVCCPFCQRHVNVARKPTSGQPNSRVPPTSPDFLVDAKADSTRSSLRVAIVSGGACLFIGLVAGFTIGVLIPRRDQATKPLLETEPFATKKTPLGTDKEKEKEEKKPSPSASPPGPPIVGLPWDEFAANEVAAERKWKGKRAQFFGFVTRVEKKTEKDYVVFLTFDPEEPTSETRGTYCHFRDADGVIRLEAVRHRAVFRGTVGDWSSPQKQLHVMDCEVIEILEFAGFGKGLKTVWKKPE